MMEVEAYRFGKFAEFHAKASNQALIFVSPSTHDPPYGQSVPPASRQQRSWVRGPCMPDNSRGNTIVCSCVLMSFEKERMHV